jgi:hypothetical protein
VKLTRSEVITSLVILAGFVGLGASVVWFCLQPDPGFQPAHEELPLVFDPPAQPDSVGPVRVRFNCARKPEPGPVTVRVYYAGHPNEAGRPHANETFEILLDPVYATGRQGDVITVPAKAMDRRVRALVDKPFGADVAITGQGGLAGNHYVLPGEDVTGIIEVQCRDEWKDG